MNAPRPPEIFQIPVRVSAEDIDEQGHVNNVVYLRWAQEVATAHWRDLISQHSALNSQLGWVVLRHEIDYKGAARRGDELLVRTWVGKVRGLSFERFTEILRKLDGKILANARTIWVPIDPVTEKPKRVSAEVRRLFAIAAGNIA